MKITTKQRSSYIFRKAPQHVVDVMEIDAEPAINSGEALENLDKLQVFFEMNDAENDVLRSVASLTNKVKKNAHQFEKAEDYK